MKKVLVLLLCALALCGCAPRRLNGWNEEDGILLARELAADIVGSAWLREHLESQGRAPALLIRPLECHGDRQSCLSGLETALARELLLSGQVRLVRFRGGESPPADSIGLLLQDLSLQDSGADALLTGWLEELPDPQLLTHRITLRLVDANSQELLLQTARTRSKPLWLRLDEKA